MTYKEMQNLKAGDRLQVLDLFGGWKPGTYHSSVNGADPAMWFAFDDRQQEGKGPIRTKVYTGMQFTEEHWDGPEYFRTFRRPTDEELNSELLEKMEMIR